MLTQPTRAAPAASTHHGASDEQSGELPSGRRAAKNHSTPNVGRGDDAFSGAAAAVVGAKRVAIADAPWNDATIDRLRVDAGIRGLQLCGISNAGMARKTYGLNGAKPWRGDDLLRIASVSKSFVAALTMIMVRAGRLALTTPVAALLSPAILPKIALDKVTIADLMRHTSGIPDYFTTPAYKEFCLANPRHEKTGDEALGFVKALPAELAPGTATRYSNTNYVVLGSILDGIAKADNVAGHPALLRAKVLTPLGLDATFYEHHERALYTDERIADGFIGATDYRDIDQGYGLANGGLLSTTGDVARFFHALFNVDAFVEVGRSLLPPADGSLGFGLGFIDHDKRFVGHGGEFAGYLTFAGHDMARNTTIVGFANDSGDTAQAGIERIKAHVFAIV